MNIKKFLYVRDVFLEEYIGDFLIPLKFIGHSYSRMESTFKDIKGSVVFTDIINLGLVNNNCYILHAERTREFDLSNLRLYKWNIKDCICQL